MFTRVRTSLLLWNLLIIGVILFAAGTITYLSQRESLLADVDRTLTVAARTQPEPALSDGHLQALLDRQVPLTLVVNSSGDVLADPQKLGVRQIVLPISDKVTVGKRLNLLWDQTLHGYRARGAPDRPSRERRPDRLARASRSSAAENHGS